jgi:partner of Y14 and mago
LYYYFKFNLFLFLTCVKIHQIYKNYTQNQNEKYYYYYLQTKRPDGTIRKERKVRPGFIAQEDTKRFTSASMAERTAPPKYVIPGLSLESGKVANNKSSSKDAWDDDGTESAPAREMSKAAMKNAKRREKTSSLATVVSNSSGSSDSATAEKHTSESKSKSESLNNNSSATTKTEESSESQTKELGPVEAEKKLKAAKKKLRQIEELEAKRENTDTLLPEQLEKISKKKEVENEITKLEAFVSNLKIV